MSVSFFCSISGEAQVNPSSSVIAGLAAWIVPPVLNLALAAKSQSFTVSSEPRWFTNIFCGLTSRWLVRLSGLWHSLYARRTSIASSRSFSGSTTWSHIAALPLLNSSIKLNKSASHFSSKIPRQLSTVFALGYGQLSLACTFGS